MIRRELFAEPDTQQGNLLNKVGNIRFCESCGMQRPPHLFSSAVLAQLDKLDKLEKLDKHDKLPKRDKIDKPSRSHHFCTFMIPVSL